MKSPEFYRATVDGSPCLLVPGRYQRQELPLPQTPPTDSDPSCFLCDPQTDTFDRGPWHPAPLHIVGNAHPVAKSALLIALSGKRWHDVGPQEVPPEILASWILIGQDPDFIDAMNIGELDLISFMNVGMAAAQSKRHPHLQVVGFDKSSGMVAGIDLEGIQREWDSAPREGRMLEVLGNPEAMLPKYPNLTAEVWMRTPSLKRENREFGLGLEHLLKAMIQGLSGSYNLAFHHEANLLRLIPRGLAERAGLELSCPRALSSVTTASPEEAHRLWQAALDQTEIHFR